MKIFDLYSKLKSAKPSVGDGYEIFSRDPDLLFLKDLAHSLELDMLSTRQWFKTAEAKSQEAIAEKYLQEVGEIVRKVETVFGRELPGTLILAPSYDELDGFARYELGHHFVLIGIDFPDSDVEYLKAITAHELSHVYRDHSPQVWKHLGKPIEQITREEYLEAHTAQEHLVSEGLATLFSQTLYPEIAKHTHHYYSPSEMAWCEKNQSKIHDAILHCLNQDENVWSFYSPSRVARGSPSRTHYFWASLILSNYLKKSQNPLQALVDLHSQPTSFFQEFQVGLLGKVPGNLEDPE